MSDIGTSDLKVTPLFLVVPPIKTRLLMRLFLEGDNFVDTADVY